MEREQHLHQVVQFLEESVANGPWSLTLPPSGRGQETYIAQRDGQKCFVKLDANLPNYGPLVALNLTPPVIAAGIVDGGKTILVQQFVAGRKPMWSDFQAELERYATMLSQVHQSKALLASLSQPIDVADFKSAGLLAHRKLVERWNLFSERVPLVAQVVDGALAQLKQDIDEFSGRGLVASHNDVSNGNWIIADDGSLYLVDLEMMSLDDPAHDLGALLWWYYPPEMRPRFLKMAGYEESDALRERMRVRMSLHSLSIMLPRPDSFDYFDPDGFVAQLGDFLAVVAGEENPHGYDD